ncbi:MAG TPA: Wzz/FepE/Etk N-terminal domain-containing protein [Nocardioidaceae bacterium]|nr:Wzz/FepE/Etk N-terminal domain-containing protein [Nocardioidaceae bacterium]
MLDLRDLAKDLRRMWWIPTFMALAGLTVGNAAAAQVEPIYRSEATVLVGPTNGAVTHTSTIRTSEDLANFYADMARRQIILEPVVEKLDLGQSWSELRDQVSAVVPDENLRLVTVTVMGKTQDETDAVANELVDQLVALSPARPGSNNQAFINEQADSLKKTIKQTQERILRLEAEAQTAASDPERAEELRREITVAEDRVGSWQRIYVELIGTEPSSDAGGLQVLDEASTVTAMDRSSPIRRAGIAGLVGGVLGVLGIWLLSRRKRRRGDPPLGAELLRAVGAEPPNAPAGHPVATADPRRTKPHRPNGVAVRARTRQ